MSSSAEDKFVSSLMADDSPSPRVRNDIVVTWIDDVLTWTGDVPDDWYDNAPIYVQKKLEDVEELNIYGNVGARAFQNAVFKLNTLNIEGSVGVDAFKYAYGHINDLSFITLDESSWTDCDLVVDEMSIDQLTGTQPFLVARSIYLTTVDEVKFIKWAQEILLEKFEGKLDLTNLECVNRVDFTECDETGPFKIIYSSNKSSGREEETSSDQEEEEILSLSSSHDDDKKVFYSNEPGEWFRPQKKTLTIIYHRPMNLGECIIEKARTDLVRYFGEDIGYGYFILNGYTKIRGSFDFFYRETLDTTPDSSMEELRIRTNTLTYRTKCTDNLKMNIFEWTLRIIFPPSIDNTEDEKEISEEERELSEEEKEISEEDKEISEEEDMEETTEIKKVEPDRVDSFLYMIVLPTLVFAIVRALEYLD